MVQHIQWFWLLSDGTVLEYVDMADWTWLLGE